MKNTRSQKGKPRIAKQSTSKADLLNLVIKDLKGELGDSEEYALLEALQALFEEKDQPTIDAISEDLKTFNNGALLEGWQDLLEIFSFSSDPLTTAEGVDVQTILFLIPVMMSIVAESATEDDVFEIAHPRMITELMVRSGLILPENGEDIRILTRTFSFDEVNLISDVNKYHLLKYFDGQNPAKGMSLFKGVLSSKELCPGIADMRLKFIVGGTTVRLEDKICTLSRLIDPLEDITDEQLDTDVTLMQSFVEELAEALPGALKEKSGVEINTLPFSVYGFNSSGIRSAVNDFDQFKVSLLFARAEQAKNPTIKITEKHGQDLEMIVLDSGMETFKIQVCCLFDSEKETTQYFDELFRDLEFRDFYYQSHSEGSAVFAKGKIKKERSNPIGMLH